MYVSDDIIFIHVPVCSGTSIASALSAPANPRTAVPKKAKAHDTAQRAREIVGATAWERAWTFTMVRNPWDRLISLFHLCLSPNDSGLAYARLAKGLRSVKDGGPSPKDMHREITARGFEWWLLEFCERYRWHPWNRDPDRPITQIPVAEWVFAADGKTPLDKVFRYETDRDALLDELRARRGITELLKLKTNAIGCARSEYFSTAGLNHWVETTFAQDFERFGYGAGW